MPVTDPDQITYQTANIHQDRGGNIIAACSVLSALGTVAVILRIYVRRITHAGLRADDYLIFAALVLVWAQFVAIFYEVQNGLGKHMIAVSDRQITITLKALLFVGPTFHCSVLCIQLSFIFLFKRIFTTQKRWFKHTLYALGFCAIVENLSVIITVLTYCTPFNYHWNKNIHGHCYPYILVYLIGLCLNLATDIAILAAPIPIIWSLQMNSRSKKAITGIFLLGAFVCITNLIRLPFTLNVPEQDVTWGDSNSSIWAHASASIGIVSACLPCFGPFFKDMGFTGSHHTNRSTLASGSRAKVKSTETYKTLEGQEPSGAGWHGSSKIELVPHDQWSVPTPRTKTLVQAPTGHVGVEPGVIKVTKDIDVSTK